jgi:SOS response regulatory protein OraA/RecX
MQFRLIFLFLENWHEFCLSNGRAEKKVAISIDAEAQQAINLLSRKGYSIEQVKAAWRMLDSNQQESVNA